jgi:hypothetical protein
MSKLLTTTSTNRPTSSAGDMYFETDTGRIIVYSGSGWSQYSPAVVGESVDDSGEVNITYGTFDEILAVENKQPGDLFYVPQEDYVTEFTYSRVPGPITGPANSSIFYFVSMGDDESLAIYNIHNRLTANASGASYYVDMDQANWGTSDWQGSQNLADNLLANALPNEATAVVSGDNNETVTITSPNWFCISNIPSALVTGYIDHSVNAPQYKSSSLLVYTGLDQFDNEVFSQIES